MWTLALLSVLFGAASAEFRMVSVPRQRGASFVPPGAYIRDFTNDSLDSLFQVNYSPMTPFLFQKYALSS